MAGTTRNLGSAPLPRFLGTGNHYQRLSGCAVRRVHSLPVATARRNRSPRAADSSKQQSSEQQQVADPAKSVTGMESEVREMTSELADRLANLENVKRMAELEAASRMGREVRVLRSEVTGMRKAVERMAELLAITAARMDLIGSGGAIPIYSTWYDTGSAPLRLRHAAQVAAFVLDRTTAADPGDITHATDELVQAVLHEDAGMQLFLLRIVEQLSRYYQIALDPQPAHQVTGVGQLLPVLPMTEVFKSRVPRISRADIPELTKTLNALSSTARIVPLDHDEITKALGAVLVILQRRNVYPAASWLLDYIKVGIDYGTARRENNHALAREILAHNFVLFSLLVPFDCPVVPVSPSLQSELRIDIAELLLEPDGVPHIRLGVEAEEEPEDEDQEHRADYNMNTAYWELATLMRYMEWACTFLTGRIDKVKISGLVGVPSTMISFISTSLEGKRFKFVEPYPVDLVQIPP